MNISFRLLKFFVSLYEAKSYTKAAEINLISQSALSQRIAKLEQTLNTKLIEKSNPTIKLTEEGRVFYEFANSALLQLDVLKERLKIKQNENNITIGFTEGVSYAVVTSFLQQFKQKNPDVIITAKKISSSDLSHFLETNLLDIAISLNTIIKKHSASNFATTLFNIERQYLVVPNIDKYKDLENITLNYIDKKPIIDRQHSHYWGTIHQQALNMGIKLNIKSVVDNDELALALVEADIGIAIISPRRTIYNVKFIKINDLNITKEIHLITKKDNYNYIKDFTLLDNGF